MIKKERLAEVTTHAVKERIEKAGFKKYMETRNDA